MTSEIKRPKVNSETARELQKVEEQFQAFDEQVSELTFDRMKAAPKVETIPQALLSQKEITNSKEIYLKPIRTISSSEKFNESFRSDYEFQREYVHFIAQNNEVIGESIDLWTKPFPGLPAEWWQIPVNKPVWGPRYVAERIAGCTYHKLSMDEHKPVGQDSVGITTGGIVVDSEVPRLEARAARSGKSKF